MGTRSGDLDPAVHAHLHRELGWSLDDDRPRRSTASPGCKGLAGDNDFRELTALRGGRRRGGARSRSTSTATGSASTSAPTTPRSARVDAVVFTGRRRRAQRRAPGAPRSRGLERLGIELDADRNAGRGDGPPRGVSTDGSEVAVLVVPTNEELEIARQALAVVRASR